MLPKLHYIHVGKKQRGKNWCVTLKGYHKENWGMGVSENLRGLSIHTKQF